MEWRLIYCLSSSEFYIRRVCSQLGSQFPPISAENFQSNFDAWKTITCDTVPMEAGSMRDDDFSPIELLPAPNNRSFNSINHDEVSLLNVACTDFSDFDTQMSPLIYSDSEGSIAGDDRPENDDNNKHGKDHRIGNSNNIEYTPIINSQRLTPEIVCNQEHAAKTRAVTKEPVQTTSKSHTTPIKRTNRIHPDKMSPSSRRLNYKQLPIEIKTSSHGRMNSESKTYLFRTKKQACQSTQINESESECILKCMPNPCHQSTSSTSDVQVISPKNECLSPIIISTSSSDGQSQQTTKTQNDTQIAQENNCQSPDLFNSFVSTKSEISNQAIANSQSSPTKNHETNAPSTFRDVFGAPDECDDIDLLSNTIVDIFEITKNSVFENVLCSASDRITPFKGTKTDTAETRVSPNVSCLSGLRVILPKFDNGDAQEIEENVTHPEIESQSSDVVDLTVNETQKIIEISSEDSVRDVEKTPERKRDLTPSTRSCLKRHSSETSVTDEKRKTPRSRLGWLTTARTSPKSETPQSRRRFDKWKYRTDINNLKVDDDLKISKPRNLFNEFKSKPKSKSKSKSKGNSNPQHNIPSTSAAKSPIIFSDHE